MIAILLASFILALISLVGIFTLAFKEERFQKMLLPLVAFAAGGLLAAAFFNLIPEAVEIAGNRISVYFWVVLGFIFFFLLEQFIHFHHCHSGREGRPAPVSYLIIFADTLHNFIDGAAVAAGFMVEFKVGLLTTLAVMFHEIPQELGDFSILIHAGWEKKKALLVNFLSSLTFLLGGLIVYGLARKPEISFFLPFAAGNFIYIAASDLVPEIHKECHFAKRNLIHFFAFLAGIGLLLALQFYFPT